VARPQLKTDDNLAFNPFRRFPYDATTAAPAPSFNSFAKLFQVPGFDVNTIVDIQRRNVEALTAANQTIAQGLQTVVQRQGEIARQSVKQFQDLVSFKPSSTSVTETLVKQIDVTKTSYEKNVTNARELGDLVAKVGSEAADILSRRVVASLDEVKAAARPKAAGRTAVVA
jgi:phasin family protein